MKVVIVYGEGLAGRPHQDLGGQTPLQAAATPNLDALARKGEVGLATVSPEGITPGIDTTHLALFGYDPRKYHSGPAAYEAASLGVALGEHDVAYRCTLVTLRSGTVPGKGHGADEIKKLMPQLVLEDPRAGGVETQEASELIRDLNEQLGSETIQFYAGRGHRHVMVWVGGKARVTCVDPQDAVGRAIGDLLPVGDGSDLLRGIMESAVLVLRDHPVNEDRRKEQLKPANAVWLWGPGRAIRLPTLTEQFHRTGAMVSRSDLRRGIGLAAGLDMVEWENAENGGEHEFDGLADAALRELARKDLVCVHAEIGRGGLAESDPKEKVRALEAFDRDLIGPLLKGLGGRGPYRLLLYGDHGTVAGATEPGPYVLAQGPVEAGAGGAVAYNEVAAKAAQPKIRDTTRLINRLIPDK